MSRKHEYHSEVHEVIDTSCHLGQELHIITSNAYGDRVLTLRMSRVIPSVSGHTGYTRVGVTLNQQETCKLRDALSDLLETPETFILVEEVWHEMEDD